MAIDIKDNGVLKFILTAFFGAHITDVVNEEGMNEKCVCIPIDRNNLHIGKGGKVCCYAFVNRSIVASQENWSHYLQMKSTSDFARKMNELGYKMPYLGNLKPANYVIHKKGYQEKIKGSKVKIEDYE